MPKAVSVMVNDVGENIERTIARATSSPAKLLRDAGSLGRLSEGAKMAVHFADGAESATVLHALA
jgi:hypothetical protein